MSDEKKSSEEPALVPGATKFENQLLSAILQKDNEIKRMLAERKKDHAQIELLTRRLKQAENQMLDRERDHNVLMHGYAMFLFAFHRAVDLADNVEAALDMHDTPDIIRKYVQVFRTSTMQAQTSADTSYRYKVQERLLAKVAVAVIDKAAIDKELREELERFATQNTEYVTDGDIRDELEAAYKKVQTRSGGSEG